MEILQSKYDIPIKVIVFIDTGAAHTMVNPNIFPGIWKEQPNHFAAASGKVFTTNYVSRHPVGIQLFPGVIIWIKVIGTELTGKDVLVGFDVISQLKKLNISNTGLYYKRFFKPYTIV